MNMKFFFFPNNNSSKGSAFLAFLVAAAIILIIAFSQQSKPEPDSNNFPPDPPDPPENGHYHPSPSPSPSPSPDNRDPNARFSCNIADCSAYGGSTDPSLILENESTDPNGKSDIAKSEWEILDYSGGKLDCPDLCDYPVQSRLLSAGDYRVELTVTDKAGESDSFRKSIRIKEDVIADFDCSLNEEGPWQSCNEFKGIQEERAYFKNTSDLSESATGVSSWIWKLNDIPFSSGTGEVTISSALISDRSNTVELKITDNKGRTDSTSYNFEGRLPLPSWQEVGS
jgi:hypothetical protein